MSDLVAYGLSPTSLYCWSSHGRQLCQTADGHPCVIIYSQPESATPAREGGHRSVPSQIHTLENTHTNISCAVSTCTHTVYIQSERHLLITQPKLHTTQIDGRQTDSNL